MTRLALLLAGLVVTPLLAAQSDSPRFDVAAIKRSPPILERMLQRAPAPSTQCPRAEVVEVMAKASADTRPVAYRNGTIYVSRTPLSTLNDVVAVNFNPPAALGLTFTRDVGERMERITGSQPNFPMAFVVDDEAVLSVVLEGGFGIGKDGLQISVDRNFDRIKGIYEALSRCVAGRTAR